MATQIPEGWRKVYRAKIDDEGNIRGYTLQLFYRYPDSWYDEVRYDYTERELAPHVHIKIRSPLKIDQTTMEQELAEVIRDILPQIQRITGITGSIS